MDREKEYQLYKAARERAENGSPEDKVLYWAAQMWRTQGQGNLQRFNEAVGAWLAGSIDAQHKNDVFVDYDLYNAWKEK